MLLHDGGIVMATHWTVNAKVVSYIAGHSQPENGYILAYSVSLRKNAGGAAGTRTQVISILWGGIAEIAELDSLNRVLIGMLRVMMLRLVSVNRWRLQQTSQSTTNFC